MFSTFKGAYRGLLPEINFKFHMQTVLQYTFYLFSNVMYKKVHRNGLTFIYNTFLYLCKSLKCMLREFSANFCHVHNFKTFVDRLYSVRMYEDQNMISQVISANKNVYRNSIKYKPFNKKQEFLPLSC